MIISIKTALIVFFFLNMAAKIRPKMLFNTLLKIKPDNKERRSSKKKEKNRERILTTIFMASYPSSS